MSMFRSAADISSDSQSSSDEGDHDVIASPKGKQPQAKNNGKKTPPITAGPGHDIDGDHGPPSPSGLPDVDAGGHAHLMTGALLEFYCMSRAADILNAQNDSHGRFTRESPEVQYLGKKMYNYKSQFLSSHGVLAGGIENEELGTTRQYYRDNLDLLGVSALEDLNLNDGQRRSPPIGTSGDIELAHKSSKRLQLLTEKEFAESAQITSEEGGGLDLQRLISGRNFGLMKGIQLDMGNLPKQALPLSSSSPVSFPLFSTHPSPPPNRMSRYEMEFSEVKVLGRGSFGEVYHVKNHIDGQNYAVKKIPLSQKRLEQLQSGGQNQLENIMKEIRTLARLEHKNVVRYYGAWIEQAQISDHIASRQAASLGVHYEQTQNKVISHCSTEDQSFGVVFEDSESSMAEVQPNSVLEDHESHVSGTKIAERRDSHVTTSSRQSRKSFACSLEDDEEIESIPRDFSTHGQMSTFGGTDDDIFTDGLSQGPSRLQQIQRRHQNASQIPAVILHIQMSLHPISLGSYLNPQLGKSGEIRRHCYHLIPSLRLILEILSGVDYLHSKGIVHRDLKPANIFLSSPENSHLQRCHICRSEHESATHYCHPRIGDFGLVAEVTHLNDISPTKPNIYRAVGTEFYRPPHESTGNQNTPEHAFCAVDEKLDIFSLGVILFELLYRLNTKMERQMVLNDLTRGRTSFPSDFAKKVHLGTTTMDNGVSVGESLMACIKGMLQPQPGQRTCCSDARKRLEEILLATQNSQCS